MRSSVITYTLFIVLTLSISACHGDFRPEASGGFSEVLVVMDSSMVQSKTADAIRQTFGAPIMTIPGSSESRYDLMFRDLKTKSDMELMKGHKNVMIVATIDEDTNVGTFLRSALSDNVKESVRQGESYSFENEDVWARNQWVLMLSANTDEELSEKILSNESRLMTRLSEMERVRWHNYVYRRAEQHELSEEILKDHGWTIRIQHDYRVGVDTLNFLSLRRYLTDNDRWIWVWWQDDFESFDEIDREWINVQRDSLNKVYFKGSKDDRYVRTDYRRPLEQRFISFNEMDAFESRGIWIMNNDLMGGPFVNYTFYDEEHKRLYMMEFGQFAPRWDKRRFLYQFDAIARTFISDPDAIETEENTSS